MIPSSAAYARLFPGSGGPALEVSLTDMSPLGFAFRSSEPCPPVSRAEAGFYSLKSGSFHVVSLKNFSITEAGKTELYTLYRLETESPDYREKARAFMAEYAAYVALKSDGDDRAPEHRLLSRSQEETREDSPDLSQMRAGLFSAECDPRWVRTAEKFSLGLSLSVPSVRREFLEKDFETFRKDFLGRMGIGRHPLADMECRHVWFGNSFCPRLCPEEKELISLMEKACGEGLVPCAVLAPVRERDRAETERLLAELQRAFGPAEVLANDPGTLLTAAQIGLSAVPGPLLMRHRKDPRVSALPDAAGPWGLTEGTVKFLKEHGVSRLAVDGWDGKGHLPLPASLIFPFYQTNTAEACPFFSPGEEGGCSFACLDADVLYPAHLGLVGRYNSVFGADWAILRDAVLLQSAREGGIDRLILEVLP